MCVMYLVHVSFSLVHVITLQLRQQFFVVSDGYMYISEIVLLQFKTLLSRGPVCTLIHSF